MPPSALSLSDVWLFTTPLTPCGSALVQHKAEGNAVESVCQREMGKRLLGELVPEPRGERLRVGANQRSRSDVNEFVRAPCADSEA